MLAFFFNRFSKMVYLMEAIGIALWPIVIYLAIQGHYSLGPNIAIAVILAIYGFIRFCASLRFYNNAPRYSGIELQFKKAMVPTSYIMAISGLTTIFFPSTVFIGFIAFLLAVIAHVNWILLYLHRKDANFQKNLKQ